MKNKINYLKQTFTKLVKDESGQNTTEYILLLVVVVAIAVVFKDQLKSLIESKISEVGGEIGKF